MSELSAHTQLQFLLSDLPPAFQSDLFDDTPTDHLDTPFQTQQLSNQDTNAASDPMLLLMDDSPDLSDFMMASPHNTTLLESFFPNLTQDRNKQQDQTSLFSRNTDVYIRLVAGFVNAPKERQPGGKDNVKYPLPLQTIKLLTDLIPRGVDIMDLCVTAHVLGFEKNKKDKVVLGSAIDERKFIVEGDEYFAKFDNLIIKYSSHLHGSKLAVRFTLLDAQRQEVCFVDSQPFATITKRGVEKRKERRTAKRKRVGDDDAKESTSVESKSAKAASPVVVSTSTTKSSSRVAHSHIHAVEPPCGPCTGGLMAKIRGEGLIATPVSQMLILFGANASPEIVSIKRNTIVCEVPSSASPGLVHVSVALSTDDDSKGVIAEQIPSDATYKYINENSAEELQELLRAMFKKNLNITTSPSTPVVGGMNGGHMSMHHQQPTPHHQASSRTYTSFSIPTLSEQALEQFMTGQLKDACGFSIVHHAARRGLTQLLDHVTNRLVDNVDEVDNFGRTAVMWAVEGGHCETARLLFEIGAEIAHRDEAQDNFLHIAARTENVEALEAFLCYLIHQDDIYCTTTSVLIELLDAENEYGETPFSIAEEKDTVDMENLFDMIHATCEAKLKQEKTFPVVDIVLRSGEDNGKRLTQLGFSHMSMHFRANQFEIYLAKRSTEKSERYMALIPHDTIAFIILSEADERVEFTFKQAPRLLRLEDGEISPAVNGDVFHDAKEETTPPLARSLSFFATLSPDRIRKVYPFIQSCTTLHEFKPMAFVYQGRVTSDDKTGTQQKSKVGAFSLKTPSTPSSAGGVVQKTFSHPLMPTKTHPILRGNSTAASEESALV